MNFSRLIHSRKLMILPPNAIGLLVLLFMVAGETTTGAGRLAELDAQEKNARASAR